MNTRKDKENNHDAIQALLEKVAKTHKMLTNGDITEKVERNIISAVSKKFIQDLKSNTSYSSGYIKTIISSIRKQIREHISPDHISLKYIKLSKQEYQEINNETMSRVKESNLNKTAINLSEFDKLTNAFLKSNLEEHLALGIALASGRRIKEVFISNIEDISESNVVLFTGQLKTKSIERFYQGYEIPLTVEKELFFDAYNRFKNSSFIHEIKTKWEEDTLSKEYIYSKLMPEFYKIFKNKFKISDFRAIYATKILDMEGYFKDKSGSKEIYHRVASLLGHKLSEGEIIGASFNYRDFCITKARVIEDLKEKLEYIKQHKKIEINKKMIDFLNKKIATGKLVDISYESDKSKTRIDGAVFNTMNNALQDALDTFKNHDSILMNKNSLNTAFRKILEKEYGYDVRNNGTKTIRFIDKFLRIEKKSKIKLKSISSRKRYNPDIIRNLIIPKGMQPLLEELKSDKSTAILRQDSHIIQFVLEKILIEREKQINVLNYDLLMQSLDAAKTLSKVRFKKITQVIVASIDKLKEATMITQENVIHSRELAEAEDGFTVAKENGDKYYKDFVIKGIIIPELHKMILNKLKSKQYSEVLFTILHDLLIKRENIKNVLRYKSLEDTFNSDTTGNKFDKEKFKILESIIKENLKEIQGKIIFNPNYLSTYEMHKARLASR